VPSYSNRIMLALLLAITVMITAGCTKDSVSWVDEGASYTATDAENLARSLADGQNAGTPVSQAYDLRQEALADLRGNGDNASELADLLTRVFVNDIRSVPFYTEAARVGDVDAWLVIESWGPSEGTLESTRLWVFEQATGDVILATTVN